MDQNRIHFILSVYVCSVLLVLLHFLCLSLYSFRWVWSTIGLINNGWSCYINFKISFSWRKIKLKLQPQMKTLSMGLDIWTRRMTHHLMPMHWNKRFLWWTLYIYSQILNVLNQVIPQFSSLVSSHILCSQYFLLWNRSE